MRNFIIAVGLAIILVALLVIYLIIPGDDSRAEFCAPVSDLENAFLTGDERSEAIQIFLDVVSDDMVSGLPEAWQKSAKDLLSTAEGALGLSDFQLDPVIDRISHELDTVTALCDSFSG